MSQDQEKKFMKRFGYFMKKYNKSYSTADEMKIRFCIFAQNILNVVAQITNLSPTHTHGITEFSDLSASEFIKQYLNLNVSATDQIIAQGTTPNGGTSQKRALTSIPASFDWRQYGIVGVVKNQGSCGSCWSFSAVGNIEGQYAIKHGLLYNFSEQQLMDCDLSDYACNGGSQQNAFNYLMQTNGLEPTSSYGSYLGYRSTCRSNANYAVAKVYNWYSAGTTSETYIASMLYTVGPLAISMNATYLQFYSSGIMYYTNTVCNAVLNHGVILVGYGSSNGVDYWIVKNSWGPYWGESGYFRITRGYGTCGINTYVVTAQVD